MDSCSKQPPKSRPRSRDKQVSTSGAKASSASGSKTSRTGAKTSTPRRVAPIDLSHAKEPVAPSFDVDTFRAAAARTSPATVVWHDLVATRKDRALDRPVVDALFAACRTLVHEATTAHKHSPNTTSPQHVSDQHDRLYVAIHSLAILVDSMLWHEMTISLDARMRVLYFSVVTVAEQPFDAAAALCRLAYRTLSRAMSWCTLSVGPQHMLRVELSPEDDFGIPTWSVPTPPTRPPPQRLVLSSRSNASDATTVTTVTQSLDPAQLCTMALAATLAVARAGNLDASTLVRLGATVRAWLVVAGTAHVSRGPHKTLLSTTAPSHATARSDASLLSATALSSHAKAALRLWSAKATATANTLDQRLRLHQTALQMVVLPTDTLDSHVTALFVPLHFGTACTMAYKVTESVRLQTDANMTHVNDFHATLGPSLDHCARQCTAIPASYFEYCAYRALHKCAARHVCPCTSCPWAAFSFVPPPHKCESALNPSTIGLAMVYLMLHLRQILHNANDHDAIHHGTVYATIITQFQRLVTTQPLDSTTTTFTGLRLYKVVSAIQLHKVVAHFLSQHGGTTTRVDASWLGTTATLLADGLAPFLFHSEGSWTAGMAHLRHAISLAEHDDSAPWVERTPTWMHQLVSHLDDGSVGRPVAVALEHTAATAKFLYGVGKKRFEAGKAAHALAPLLLALKLLVPLSVAKTEYLYTLKISSRFHFLAVVYKALNMADEALLAVVTALTFDAVEVEPCDSQVDLAVSLMQCTMGTVSKGSLADSASGSGQRTSLEALMLQMMRRPQVESTTVSPPVAPLDVVELLLASLTRDRAASELWEERCGTSLSPWSIVSATFVPPHDLVPSDSRHCTSSEKVKVLVDLMVKLGRDLQKRTCTTAALTAALNDYESVCRLAHACLQETGAAASTLVTKSLLYTVASASLISVHPLADFDSWCIDCCKFRSEKMGETSGISLARQYAAKARAALDEPAVYSRDWGLLAKALDSAIELYCFQLSCIAAKEKIPHEFNLTRLKRLAESLKPASASSCCAETASLSKQIILTLLSRLCGLFALDGEYSCAIQVAKWSSDATKVDGDDPRAWFEANVLSRLTTDSLISIQVLDSLTPLATLQPFAMEEHACMLRLLVRDHADFDQVDSLQNRFMSLLHSIDEPADDISCDVLSFVRWTKSTILLGLSECAERRGSLHLALRLRQECFEECRKVGSALTKYRARKCKENPTPFWTQVAYSSLPARCTERQIECIQGVAVLYGRLGDHRKANDYALLALKPGSTETAGLTSKCSFADVVAFSRSHPPASCQDMRSRRLLLRLKSTASPLDLVSNAFDEGGRCELQTMASVHSQLSMDEGLEEIKDIYEIVDMLNGYQALSSVRDEWDLHKRATKRFVRYSISPEVAMLVETVATDGRNSQKPLQLQYDAKLRDAALLLSDNERGGHGSESAAVGWLSEIVQSSNCSNVCRAWSYFLLGSVALEKARRARHLQRMWDDAIRDSFESPFLVDARSQFNESLQLLGSSRDLLKRYVLRSQALAYGPNQSIAEDLTSFELINASIGTSVARELRCTGFSGTLDDCDLAEAGSFLDQLGMVVSAPWRFVSAALCPSGELLLASVEYSISSDWSCRVSCVFPELEGDMFDEILQPLHSILRSSQDQLSEDLDSSVDDGNKAEDNARRWWNTRKQCDSNLQEMLRNVERILLSTPGAERVLLGLTEDDHRGINDSMLCENLAAKFDAAGNGAEEVSTPYEYTDPQSMKVVELRTVLEKHGHEAKAIRKMKKTELVRLLQQTFDRQDSIGTPITNQVQSRSELNDACTFLILDEYLQKFPFEGLAMFADRAVCRLPSLSFALATLTNARAKELNMSWFDAEKLSYILDPESNLLATRERLSPFLDSLQDAHGYCWTGTIGEAPATEFMEQALSTTDGLLLYFGHGGGQQYYSRSKIEALGQACDGALPSIVLMGCSSGRLESVNTKQSKSLSKVPIHYEPEGLALTYLLSGAPCVVANLWDVTDRDIDRYSMALLASIFDTGTDGTAGRSIAQCVADARRECKLQYMVGCAPVCYGFPVTKRLPL